MWNVLGVSSGSLRVLAGSKYQSMSQVVGRERPWREPGKKMVAKKMVGLRRKQLSGGCPAG